MNRTQAALILGLIVALLIVGCVAGTPTPSKPNTPAATATPSVYVRYKGTILDKETQQPVTGTVKLDDVVMFRDVSKFELILPNDTREKMIFVQVEAAGYQNWAQGYRYFWSTSKVFDFPIELEREVRR